MDHPAEITPGNHLNGLQDGVGVGVGVGLHGAVGDDGVVEGWGGGSDVGHWTRGADLRGRYF